jgi:hypothetical protein
MFGFSRGLQRLIRLKYERDPKRGTRGRVGKPRFGARIKIEDAIWNDLNQVASSLNMKATRLANMLIRAAVRDKLVGAIIDAPAPKPVPRRAPTPTVSMIMAPQLVGQFTDVVFDVAAGGGN